VKLLPQHFKNPKISLDSKKKKKKKKNDGILFSCLERNSIENINSKRKKKVEGQRKGQEETLQEVYFKVAFSFLVLCSSSPYST